MPNDDATKEKKSEQIKMRRNGRWCVMRGGVVGSENGMIMDH